jgi:hypothetical protein
MRLHARVPITFEGIDGQTQHAPLAIATLGGRTTRFVLDTGSDVHLLNEDLADALGLDKVAGEEGVDHGGATMPSWSVGAVAMDLGEARLTLHDVVAIPAPPPFPGWGVGGILAPQMLHPTAAAVLDLVRGELLLADGSDDELEAFLRDRSPDLTLLRLPRDVTAANVVVRAAIAGYPEIPTLVDTGGKRTEASAASVPGILAAESGALGRGVGGNEFTGASAGRQTIVVAGQRIPVRDLAVRPAMHGAQCLIGMDVLRGTVLTCAADINRPVFWQVQVAA